jgi:hypothetical protein
MKFLPGEGFFASQAVHGESLIFGGTCLLNGAVSPNTGLPLTQLVQVEINAESFSIPGWERDEIHFLYSWKCKIHEDDFSYRYTNAGIEVIEFCEGVDDYDGFPYDDYPIFFPEARVRLLRIQGNDQSIILQLNSSNCDPEFKFGNPRGRQLSIPTHQFGGVPYLVDSSAEGKICAICGNEMPLVASVGNKSFSPNEGFSGNDFVQILYWTCSSCGVVSARNFCD